MKVSLRIASLGTGLLAAAFASAQLTPIGQFSGALSESFEGFNNYVQGPFALNNPEPIMGGMAQIQNQQANMVIYEPGTAATFGLGTSGSAQVADGAKGLGLDANSAYQIGFVTDQTDFGAFWGASTSFGDPATVTLAFFDGGGGHIATTSFSYTRSAQSDGLLEWAGWNSSVPFRTVEIRGPFVVADAMQANPVPEPATVIALGLGAVALLRRRRKTS